jgi:TatD DNase family protein
MSYDFHTHLDRKGDQHLYILKEDDNTDSLKSKWCGLGIHPWSKDLERSFQWFEKNYQNPKISFYGEMGLDRLQGDSVDNQLNILKNQLDLIKDSAKLIQFHCVRAFDLIIKEIKDFKLNGPIIFHDYKGNEEITHNLLNYDTYFSFNSSLLNDPKRQTLLSIIPDNRILFETDEKQIETLNELEQFFIGLNRSQVLDHQRSFFQKYFH